MTIGSTVFKIEIATIFELVVPNSVKVLPARVEAIGTEGVLICIETLDGSAAQTAGRSLLQLK